MLPQQILLIVIQKLHVTGTCNKFSKKIHCVKLRRYKTELNIKQLIRTAT